MKYEAKTPEEYLNKLENDWRKEKLEVIRSYLLKSGPELQENIAYNMLSYGNSEKTLFHLNAQKNYVSLYVGDVNKIANGRELLEGFNMGKGCIRVQKTTDISQPNLKQFIVNTIEAWRQGKDVYC